VGMEEVGRSRGGTAVAGSTTSEKTSSVPGLYDKVLIALTAV
jgi:hypothetical protein